MGFLSKLWKTATFTRQHIHNIFKGFKKRGWKGMIFGGTPLGTKIGNAVFGTNYKPLTDQTGGATSAEKAAYKAKNGADSLGYSSELHAIGSAIATFYGVQGVWGVGAKALGAGSAAAGGGAAAATPAVEGATSAAAGVGEALPEIVVQGAAQSAAPAVAGATAGGAVANQTSQPAQPAPAPAPTPARGFLSTLWNAAKSEQGLQIIGGVLQGYASDRAQAAAIKDRNTYTRPFTSDEIAQMAGAPAGGFLDRARRVADFMHGTPTVGAPTTTPADVAGLARGGT